MTALFTWIRPFQQTSTSFQRGLPLPCPTYTSGQTRMIAARARTKTPQVTQSPVQPDELAPALAVRQHSLPLSVPSSFKWSLLTVVILEQ